MPKKSTSHIQAGLFYDTTRTSFCNTRKFLHGLPMHSDYLCSGPRMRVAFHRQPYRPRKRS